MIRWWIGLWDRREHPRSLAGVRILLASVVLVDLLVAQRLDVVVGIWGDLEAGGIVDVVGRKIPEVCRWLLQHRRRLDGLGCAWAVQRRS